MTASPQKTYLLFPKKPYTIVRDEQMRDRYRICRKGWGLDRHYEIRDLKGRTMLEIIPQFRWTGPVYEVFNQGIRFAEVTRRGVRLLSGPVFRTGEYAFRFDTCNGEETFGIRDRHRLAATVSFAELKGSGRFCRIRMSDQADELLLLTAVYIRQRFEQLRGIMIHLLILLG